MADSSSVIVVGGGPAGALLAFLFARGGVATTLIERHIDFSREFRGEGMTPGGMAAIRAAGLWGAFDRLPATKLVSMAMYSRNRPFIALDLDEVLPEGAQFIRILAQPRLLEFIVSEASVFSNFSFLRGVVVRDVLIEEGRVVGVRIGEEGAERELRAGYVVAADGRYSTLRKRLGFELGGDPQVFDVVWCKVPRPSGMVKGRVYSFLLDEFFALAFPTEDDHVQVGRIIPKGSFRDFKGQAGGDWAAKVAESLPREFREGFIHASRGDVHPVLLDVVCGSMERWSAPGICFVGDAAHPMSPIGAQGINVALRDAVVAANHLGPELLAGRPGEELDAAAAAFERERRTEVDKVQAQQTEAPKRFAAMQKIAGLVRLIPSRWIGGFARWVLGLRSTRNFIEGVSALELTFGKPGD